ncbi:hypothetical protein BJ875DRAFT_99525 [Amylocarpus encephaloides]|uniref:Uncharacterized protein n=1 Tax=Amylocarpus encephaloides TaxID=45428 RepID=A0A9P8C310_9HELO|nr:hypothetical protein BJ875DRAFT_99525 [Amylocarpus encephaloides]
MVPISTKSQETRTTGRLIVPTITSLSSALRSSTSPVRLVSNTTTALLPTTAPRITPSSTSAAVLSTSPSDISSFTSPLPFSTFIHSHISLLSSPPPTSTTPSPTSTSSSSPPAPTAAPIISSKPVPTIAGVPQPVFICLLVVIFLLTFSSITLGLFLARRKKKRQRIRQIEAELLAEDSWTEQALAKLVSPVFPISDKKVYELGGVEAKKKSIYELEVLRRKTAMCELPSNSRNTTQWPPLPPRK